MGIDNRMDAQSNKTIMCSILFLDIVGYSRCSVAGQISLKERFNRYLSLAIRDTPLADRVILDTGDGAAINFLGDVEDALKVALSLRDSLRGADANEEDDHPLQVRIGINLGPVRLVRDLNGQPNIVGDGINVAQRIMGFSEINQVLVSRSYYDAVSRLSPEYAGMFHYQGSRTDKHVREHEVYAIGDAGGQTLKMPLPGNKPVVVAASQASHRYLYIALAALLAVLVGIVIKLSLHQEANSPDAEMASQENASQENMVAQPKPVSVEPEVVMPELAPAVAAEKKKVMKAKPATKQDVAEPSLPPPPEKLEVPQPVQEKAADKNLLDKIGDAVNKVTGDSFISVNCKEGVEVFVDGARRGRVAAWPLLIALKPGKHIVLLSIDDGAELHSQEVVTIVGKTSPLKPPSCNR